MESPNIDDNDYILFLQDQVRRLNAVLKEYQRRYMPINEPNTQEDEPVPPWITDKSVLTPLLLEYDETIRTLKAQVDFYKKEHSRIKESAENIVNENSRLHDELKKNVENQLNAYLEVEGASGVNQEVLDNLKHQLGIINQEKDNYKEMWEQSCRDVKEIQSTLQAKTRELTDKSRDMEIVHDDLQKARKYAESLQRVNNKLKLEHEEYLQSAQLHDKEVESSREELRRCRTELKTLKLKNDELLNHLERVQCQVKLLDQDSQRISLVEKTSENTVRELQNIIVELESRVASCSKEIGKLRGERNELEDTLARLTKKNAELEEKEYQASLHVRDSVQLVENALLEREQAVVKEQQKSQEVKRIQESLNSLLKDAEKRKYEEVDVLKRQHKEQIERLADELNYLEMEGAEKQAQLERAMREKASVEKELEKVYQEGPSEINRAGMTYEELQKKLLRSDVAKDEVQLELDQLRSSQRRNETQHENDIGFLKSQLEESSKRVKSLQDEVETVSTSRMQLLDEIDQLKRSLDSAQLSKNELELKCAAEVSALQQKMEVKERDFESRARAMEEMNRKTINELREMLTAQQRVGTKWREESKTMTHKYESRLTDLNNEVERLRKKNENLVRRLNEEEEKCDQLDQELLTQKSTKEKLQRMSADAEARADAAGVQVQTLLNRERQLLQERKELNNEVDRLKLESTRTGLRQRGANRFWTDAANDERARSSSPSNRLPRYHQDQ